VYEETERLVFFDERQFGLVREIGMEIPITESDRYWQAVALLLRREGRQHAYSDEAVRRAALAARELVLKAAKMVKEPLCEP
jgi:hypothetical protein